MNDYYNWFEGESEQELELKPGDWCAECLVFPDENGICSKCKKDPSRFKDLKPGEYCEKCGLATKELDDDMNCEECRISSLADEYYVPDQQELLEN